MTETLPPYSGDDTTCPKCAHLGASTRFRAASARMLWDTWNDKIVSRGPLPERLQRECNRCGWCWDEDLATGPLPTTDRDRLLTLLDAFNIQATHGDSCANHADYHITLTAGDDRIDGERGLYCLFIFDTETGTFKDVGVWS